ncbi:two-pore potassium channel 1 [Populus nigra]|uniref:two-pore potassium channel 1 n=1 Tax=Populus nigra TaxID=3691 RepID=UPI002B27866F|nr:two-pore potassium channel 1 [Populus nigra]XP_061964753.1 two-pore potassium channel 1 [Populus nigra]
MACNGAKKPLLSGLVDSTSQRIDECTPYRRRFRRVKSAPVTELIPSDISGNGPVPRYESFFGGRHESLKQVAVFLAVYLGLGTLCFYVFRDDIKGKKSNPILDSLYFCIVTMTTVGYGDLVPDSAPVKLLACVFVFTGMLLIGLILSKAADYLVEKQEILLIKALRMHRKLDPAAFLKEIETNKVKYKCYLAIIILSVLMLVGTIFLYMVEDLDIIDAFYCVCSTVTTLGYGDKSFSTVYGRMFAVFWILTGTIALGQLFLYIAELFTESRQRALVNWVLTRRMTHLDLEAADIDDDGVVGAAEFVVYKLKEMGKISEEDIALVMKEFEDLDVDQSGTLSVSDIMAQTTQTHK